MRQRIFIICTLLALLLAGCDNGTGPDKQGEETTATVQTILLDEKLTASEAQTLAAAGTYKYSYTNYTIELKNESYAFNGNEYFVFQATIPINEDNTSYQIIDPPVAVDKITGEIFAVYPDQLVPIAEDSFWGIDRNSTIEVAKHYNWNGQFVREDYSSVLNLVADDKQGFHFSLKLENEYGQCSLKSLEGRIFNSSSTNELNNAVYEDPNSNFVIRFTFLDDETIQIVTEGENPYAKFNSDTDYPIDGKYVLNKLMQPEL